MKISLNLFLAVAITICSVTLITIDSSSDQVKKNRSDIIVKDRGGDYHDNHSSTSSSDKWEKAIYAIEQELTNIENRINFDTGGEVRNNINNNNANGGCILFCSIDEGFDGSLPLQLENDIITITNCTTAKNHEKMLDPHLCAELNDMKSACGCPNTIQ